ncbi:hypothetical protein SAMN04515647_3694 [Cohaesibacter sp. ES.047]|uniref:hypothetical protein n=1 Tax=Cohaesibacter sp. ES.047 TaxID=1798205 RepID=UPI000BB8E862|nr:hypothetical protein [Cohaesibacter sp. ES.047]SNY93399.1 hypothetical protein SAMN04515647_3694 [Cohaesibacter sp. ES.047]
MTKALSSTALRAVNWRVVGLIVNARRVADCMSEGDLADKLGVCTKTVRRIESQQPCSAYTLKKVMAWTGEGFEVLSWQDPGQARVAA